MLIVSTSGNPLSYLFHLQAEVSCTQPNLGIAREELGLFYFLLGRRSKTFVNIYLKVEAEFRENDAIMIHAEYKKRSLFEDEVKNQFLCKQTRRSSRVYLHKNRLLRKTAILYSAL